MKSDIATIYPHVRLKSDSDEFSLNSTEISKKTYYYLKIIEDFRKKSRYFPPWNWQAAIFGSLWMVYRKMYLYTVFYLIIISIYFSCAEILFLYNFDKIPGINILLKTIIYKLLSSILIFFIMGFYGNRIYIHFISKKITKNRNTKYGTNIIGLIFLLLIELLYFFIVFFGKMLQYSEEVYPLMQ